MRRLRWERTCFPEPVAADSILLPTGCTCRPPSAYCQVGFDRHSGKNTTEGLLAMRHRPHLSWVVAEEPTLDRVPLHMGMEPAGALQPGSSCLTQTRKPALPKSNSRHCGPTLDTCQVHGLPVEARRSCLPQAVQPASSTAGFRSETLSVGPSWKARR